MLTLLPAIVIGWLPGAVLFRLPWLDRERRAALEADERIFWQVVISVALSLAVVLALAALDRYSFERLLIVDLGAAIALASLARFRLRLGSAAARPGWDGADTHRSARSCDRGGSFHRRNTSSAARIPACTSTKASRSRSAARSSAPDPVIASVPNFARDLFFPSEHRTDYYSGRFMGFFIQEPGAGTRRRAVPAPLPGIDCDRLRPRRPDRSQAGDRPVGRPRRARGLFRGRTVRRARSRRSCGRVCWRST